MTKTAMQHRHPPRAGAGALKRIKVRLQFTGWLQYIINAVVVSIFGLLALVVWAIGAPSGVVWIPTGVAAALTFPLVFDLVVLKAGLRPTERIPPPRDRLDAFDLMLSRRSCRSFQTRDLTRDHREALLDSVRTHSAAERQIGSAPIRFEYVAAPLTVWPVIGAHEFLVAIAPHEYDRSAVIDVGRSLQRVVLDATRMGVATCWIGPGADHASIVQHLGDNFDADRDHIICVCAVGYESRFKPLVVHGMQFIQHRRKPLDRLFFADPRFRAPLDIALPPFSAFGRCYEACRWSPSSYNGQTTRCVGFADQVDGDPGSVRFDFYAATPSRFYAPVALGIWLANWEAGCRALDIPGHFEVLTPEARGVGEVPELPRYDVSWVADR